MDVHRMVDEPTSRSSKNGKRSIIPRTKRKIVERKKRGKTRTIKKKILRENSNTTGSQTDNEFWVSFQVDVIDLSEEARNEERKKDEKPKQVSHCLSIALYFSLFSSALSYFVIAFVISSFVRI